MMVDTCWNCNINHINLIQTNNDNFYCEECNEIIGDHNEIIEKYRKEIKCPNCNYFTNIQIFDDLNESDELYKNRCMVCKIVVCDNCLSRCENEECPNVICDRCIDIRFIDKYDNMECYECNNQYEKCLECVDFIFKGDLMQCYICNYYFCEKCSDSAIFTKMQQPICRHCNRFL